MKYNTVYYTSRVRETVGDEYSVLGEYVDYNHTKIRMRHNVCGYEYDILPSVFLKGTRCAKCAGLKKKSTEEYRAEVRALEGDNYIVLGEYVNSKTKIKMKHSQCGAIYEVKPNVFLAGSRCPFCRKNKPYTDESFRKKYVSL